MSSPKSNPENDAHCGALGIPAHLHQNSRPANQSFAPGELLFRRYGPDEKIINGKPSGAIFEFRRMSVGRAGEDYCRSPLDVLYDSERDKHWFNWGVVELRVEDVEGQTYT